MQAISKSIRRLAPTVVLALALLALAAGPAAGAGTSDGKSNAHVRADEFVPGVTDFPSRLGEIGERAAESRLAELSQQASPVKTFIPGVTDFPSRLGEIGERAAEARLAQPSQQSPVITIEESGFDWSAGATGALAAALLLLAAALAVRTTRRTRVALG
jgi:hypothetical protein